MMILIIGFLFEAGRNSDMTLRGQEWVNEQGDWFCRHVHSICDFVKANPYVTSKPAQEQLLFVRFDNYWTENL